MFDPSLRAVDLYLSLIVGVIAGLIIGLKLKRPATIWGFVISVLLNLLSPWIMVSTWLVAINDLPRVVGSPFLFGMLTVMNVVYIVRLIMGSKAAQNRSKENV